MSIIKFPEHKIKRQWLLKVKNADKASWTNFFFSLSSVFVSLVIVWFILHKMNA